MKKARSGILLSAIAILTFFWTLPELRADGLAEIRCIPASTLNYYCGPGSGGCHNRGVLYLSSRDCRDLKIRSGHYEPQSLLRLTQSRVSNPALVWPYCTLLHELTHFEDAPRNSQESAESEVTAYVRTDGCVLSLLRKHCQKGREGWSDRDCGWLRLSLRSMRASRFINLCKAQGDDRDACLQGCMQRLKSASECIQAIQLYLD